MNDPAETPYRLPTQEELANLNEYWWHSWLVDPIKRGDLPAIKRYLAQKPAGLQTECPSFFDPFIVAAQQLEPGALRLLLEHWTVHPTPGEPAPNERGYLLLNVACAHGALETARCLLDEQPAIASLHARSAHGYTPILEAAASFVSYATKEQSDILAETFDAQAARERVDRSDTLVRLLLHRGASARDSSVGCTEWDSDPAVGGSDHDEDTVLSLAIARAGPALLQQLIDHGADAFTTTSDRPHHPRGYLFEDGGISTKLTLLHLAAFYGNYPAVEVLMKHYAQRDLDWTDAVACQDQFGRLPIHYAAAGWPGAQDATNNASDFDLTRFHTGGANTDTIALLRILTDSGSPSLTNSPDHQGETPLHYAVTPNLVSGRASSTVAWILCTQLHASAKLRGRGGETPVHRLWHDRRSHHELPSINSSLAALLLNLGRDFAADIDAVDDAGNTPLHFAAPYLADVQAARFLLDCGADVRMRNNNGRTPLHEAAGGQYGIGTIPVKEMIQAQDSMLAVLCGSAEEGLVLEKNWNPLMDEGDVNGKTPRLIAEESRKTWQEEEQRRARSRENSRGRGRGR